MKIDGKRYRKVTVDKLTLRVRVTKPLGPGTHRVRVYFRPFDRTAYAPSKSVRAKLRVLRR